MRHVFVCPMNDTIEIAAIEVYSDRRKRPFIRMFRRISSPIITSAARCGRFCGNIPTD